MLFLSLALTKNNEYLLGSTSDGELYVWLFKDILLELLNDQSSDGENVFNHICQFKLKHGKVSNLVVVEGDLDSLYFQDDYFLYSITWSDLLSEIKDKNHLGYPGTKISKTIDQFKGKFHINQAFQMDSSQKITACDYDLKNKRCFLATNRGNIVIVNLEDLSKYQVKTPLTNLSTLEENLLSINAVKYYKDNFVIFGNEKGQIQLWDFEGNQEVKTYKLTKDSLSPIRSIGTDKETRWIVVGHDDYITKWHLESAILSSAIPAVGKVNCLLVGEGMILSGHDSKEIYQWSDSGDLISKTEISGVCTTTIIGDTNSKEKVFVSAGSGPLVDVFLNSKRMMSFLA